MCSQLRCPESMWLFKNSWHGDWSSLINTGYELDNNYNIKSVSRPTTEFDEYNDRRKANIKQFDFKNVYNGNYKVTEESVVDQSVDIDINQRYVFWYCWKKV